VFHRPGDVHQSIRVLILPCKRFYASQQDLVILDDPEEVFVDPHGNLDRVFYDPALELDGCDDPPPPEDTEERPVLPNPPVLDGALGRLALLL
jgi:hypothetical protein